MIYKYNFAIDDQFSLELPRNAQILCVKAQESVPVGNLWALVDKYSDGEVGETEFRYFCILPTRMEIPLDSMKDLVYIGTVFQFDNSLVWHIWENRKYQNATQDLRKVLGISNAP